jgi:hypothetical protein
LKGRNVKQAIALCLATVLGWVMHTPAYAQELASQLVGVWKTASFSSKDVESGKSVAAMGERPAGVAHYSKTGHFIIFGTAQNRTNKEATPTDEERLALFKSMFSWGGTYKVDGGKIIHSVDVSWSQSWVGTTRGYSAEVVGNKLTLTTPVFKHPIIGKDSVVVTVYERVE